MKILCDIFVKELALNEDTFKKVTIYPAGSAAKLILPGQSQDWRDTFWRGCVHACAPESKDAFFELANTRDYINWSTAVAAVSTISGAVAVVGGVSCMIAGTALTGTGILADAGIPPLVGGAIGTGPGAAATAGGIHAGRKAKKEEKERRRAVERAKKIE